MSTRLARQEMKRFLENDRAEVLSVSGRWGVGKTYGWNQALAEARAAKRFPRARYAYVSAFGVRSIEALKASIFQSTVKLDENDIQPSLESFQDLIGSLKGLLDQAEKRSRQSLNLISRAISAMPVIGKASDLVVPGASLLIRHQLVCIDDVERAGHGLDLSDILGFVSSLREEKNCKVVLLLNEEGFGQEREKEFRKHLEKVVDQAVRYTPTAEEAAEMALDDADPIKPALSARLRKLGITNIRVIRRIRRFLGFVEPQLDGLHNSVTNEVIAGIALLGWALFEPGLAPPIEYVRKRGSYEAIFHEGDPTPQEAEWNALLDSYGFTHFSDLDEVLLRGLRAGGFDSAAVLREAEAMNRDFAKADVQQAMRRPWEILGSGYGDDEAEFRKALVESIEKHGADMAPNNADAVVSTLRELGDGAEADRLVKLYVQMNVERARGFFDLANHHLRGTPDDGLSSAFADHLATMPLDRDPKAILLKIDEQSGWNPEDTEFLASLPEKEYLDLFRRLGGSELRSVLHAALKFRRLGGDPVYVAIGEKTVAALRALGAESPLNAMRVRAYVGDVTKDQPEVG